MDFLPVDASTVRTLRATRCALAGGLALVLIVSLSGSLRADDPVPAPATAPSMPDEAPNWTPPPVTSPPTAPAGDTKPITGDKSVSGAKPPATPAAAKPPVINAAATSSQNSSPSSNPTASNTTGSNTASSNTASSSTPAPNTPTPSVTPPSPLPSNPPPLDGPSQYFQREDLLSVQVRAAAIQGQGPVQDLSLFPVEVFPFFLMDRQLYFADVRAFPTVDGTFGGNVGFGYRIYNPSLDRVFGISGWYDADGTRDPYFQQLGLSLETYGRWWDFRTNLYLPIGQTDDQTSLTPISNSSRFVGSNVVYSELQGYIAAMGGVDMEFGIPIPGKFAEDHNVRVYGGWYYFVDDQGDHITGGSARIQANLYQGVDASVQVTNDNFYDTRAFFSLSWTFGPLHRSETSDPSQQSRLGEHVTRNYTVLAPTRSQVDPNIVAIDPVTGSPYTFAHVNSAAATGGNGTINSPFQTIGAALATDATIIFVHANSVFSGSNATLVLNPGQTLLGDGAGLQHILAVNNGTIVLPQAASSTSLPVLESSTGNAITLAAGSFVSGFTITNAASNGIFGNGASNAVLQNVTINNAGGDGIFLSNSTGTVTIGNATITNSAGNGLSLEGGTANIAFSGSVSGSQGYDLVVANTGSGTINMAGLQLPGSGSQGVLLYNNAGNVSFDNLSVLNSAGRGIDIEGNSGQLQFAGTTTVSGAAAESVNIQSLLSTGSVTFDNLSIGNRQGPGLAINESNGTVSVTGTTTITNETGSNASAISISNSSGNTTFGGAVTVSNAATNPGVSLQSNTGVTTFSSLNVTSVNGTGLSANEAGTLVINSAQTAGGGGTISSVNGTAVDIENTNMNVSLAAVSSSNSAAGIKLIASPGSFFVTGDANNSAGSGGTIQTDTVGVVLQNTGTVGLLGMNLTSNGVGIQAQNVQILGVGNSTISGSSSFGLDALNVGTLNINSSTFTGNGAASIRSQYNQFGAYTINLASSTLTSSSADNLLIAGLSGSEGSTLTALVQSSAFSNSATNTAGINLSWNGNLNATIEGNSFAGTGGSNTGVLINNASTLNQSTITLTGNEFAANGGNDVGYHIITAGPSAIALSSNTVQFGAANGTGMEFSLGPNASVELSANQIFDNAGGATGILFDSVTGPSTIGIDGNSISVPNGGGPDRGIIFTSVTDPVVSGMTYMVILSGTENNTVTGTATPFSVPASTTTGGILVNGAVVP
jgi:Right handed beta helix region